MPIRETQRAFLQLHFCVFLWGFTAILGKLISISSVTLVWWRMLITCICLLFLKNIFPMLRQIPRRTLLQLTGVGVLVALHWLAFYEAIKLSNASVTLVGIATMSFFAAFLEPLIFRKPIKWYEVGLGVVILPAMVLIVRHLDWSMIDGFLMGLASSFLGAAFGIMNKKMVEKSDPLLITFVELGSGWLFLSLLIPIFFRDLMQTDFIPAKKDFIYLIVLSAACTAVPFVLSLKALRHISAFGTLLAINMEPVYGIALAWLILGENKELSPEFYVGICIILITVFTYPLLQKKFERKPESV